jgi:hypothetical protein
MRIRKLTKLYFKYVTLHLKNEGENFFQAGLDTCELSSRTSLKGCRPSSDCYIVKRRFLVQSLLAE